MHSVNIILAAYNGSQYIKEQLDSLLNSNYRDFRVFVCDDCSTDNTREIVEQYVEAYPGKVFLTKNERNLGSTLSFLTNLKRISEATPSSYYMFCDQDDVWLSDKISLAVRQISPCRMKMCCLFPHRLSIPISVR